MPNPSETRRTTEGHTIIKTLANQGGKRIHVVRARGGEQVLKEYSDRADADKEWSFCSRIKAACVPGYLERFETDGKFTLVQESFHGASGEEHARRLRTLEEKLAFAKALAEGLKQIHDKGVVYNALSLDNMLVGEDGQVLFFDFASSFMDGDTPPPFSEKNLLYLAPEKTGKVDHPLSFQGDLYSLGVICYRLFCGMFPFQAQEPSELISLHVAGRPEAPRDIDARLPGPLSDIIMKLLEKDSGERYLTVDGLLYDLGRYAAPDFVLGGRDAPRTMQISQKVYGRDKEIARLKESIDNVVQGQSNFSVIAGYSGVGKSTLVKEIYRLLDHQGCFFISGKFQQYKRSIPYFAFVEAINEFVDKLLFSQDEVIQKFEESFHAAIGDQGKVLTSVFPSLEMVVGEQNDIEKLMGVEAENRFKFVFFNFIDVVATPERPLILFLDDLQWTDIVSLNILKALVQSRKKHVMVFLAYRDNEVGMHHPFHQMMEELRGAQVPMDHIKLEDLALDDIEQLVSDSLRRSAPELGQIIFDKTHGNSFFVHQFLKNLIDRELVRFDKAANSWFVDQGEIETLEVSENVVDFMQQRIQRLDGETREVLKLIGAIGHNVSLPILSIVADRQAAALETALARPLEDRMLLRRGDHFFFVHDKIQQACYQLNDVEDLPGLHFEIANILIDNGLFEKLEDLFTVTSHLSKGFSCITGDYDRYIRMYLIAGQKSREVSAYSEYLEFIRQAMALLPHSDSPELEFACFSENHIALHLNGRYDEADEFFAKNIQTNEDIFSLKDNYVAKVSQDSLRGRYRDATAFGLSILDKLGVKVSPDPEIQKLVDELAHIRAEFDTRGIGPITDLLKVEKKKPQEMEFMCELISAIVPPSFFYNPMVSGLLIFATIRLAMENGVYEAMGYPFSTSTAPFIMVENNYKTGYEYAEFAIRISGDNKRSLGNSKHLFILFAYHWLKPLKDNWCLETAREAFHLLQQGGDIQMAGFIYFNTIPYTLERGDELAVVLEEIEKGLDLAEKTQNFHSLGTFYIYQQLAWTLMSEDADVTRFAVNGFDEDAHLQQYEANVMSHCYFHILKTMLLYLFRLYDEALPHARRAMELLPYITGFIPVSTAHFYVSLVLCRTLEHDRSVLEELNRYVAQWEIWASYCRENWRHKLYLIQAERSRALGDSEEAIRLYGLAVQEAKRNQFTQDIAISYERFADFWFGYGNDELGQLHIAKAYEHYSYWGAERKLRALEEEFKSVLSSGKHRDYDLLNIIKAQNLLARETRIETLVRQLLKILLEVSGAEKVLLLRNRREWRIEGFRDVQGNEALLQDLPVSDEHLSSDMVKYTIRTGKEVSLDKFSRYLQDDYVKRVEPKSILVLPVTSQSRTTAIIYLEHSGIENLFTPDKRETIQLLSSQIAISLINAQVYDDLEALVDERTNELEKQNEELVIAQQVAEEATKAKSSFLANMSHEIRTPLNAIMGMANLALMTQLNMQQQDYVNKILSSGRHLLGVINDILDFSKIEAQKLTLESVHFHLGSVLDNIGSIVGAAAEEKGLELVFSCPPDLLRGYVGDPLRLSQILTNLISNAIKFTEKGEVIVDISLKEEDDKTVQLRFSVTDTGVGLTREQADRLFQPFSQADASTTRKHGGTGLGLSICSRLVGIMGGEIGLQSAPGKGSTFWFWTPFLKSTDGRDPRLDSYQALLGKRLLIVEDNDSTRDVLQDMLLAVGFAVEAVENGEDALGRLKRSEEPAVDLVLMDWNLPGINGLEAARLIKNSEDDAPPPTIVMVTAYAKEDLASEAERIGLDGFLLKPVNPSLLIDTVARALTGQGALRLPTNTAVQWSREALQPIEGARILITEDNELNIQVLEELLQGAGFFTRVARNGREAIESLNRESFDLVFMDIQMPEMDGYEAVAHLRGAGKFDALPIIALTAHAMESERRKCLEAGMNDHLAKPINPALLQELLLTWIDPGERAQAQCRTAEPCQPADDLPQHLPGLDIKSALPRFSRNTVLYRSLLAGFQKDYESFQERIQDLLQQEQEREARRQAHSLKGVAANIGAEAIAGEAAALEDALENEDQGRIVSALHTLDRLFAEVFGSINTLLAPVDVEREMTPLDLGGARRLLVDFALMLHQGRYQAASKTDAVLRALEGHAPPAELLRLEQAMNIFDFEAAGAQADRLAQQLGFDIGGGA